MSVLIRISRKTGVGSAVGVFLLTAAAALGQSRDPTTTRPERADPSPRVASRPLPADPALEGALVAELGDRFRTIHTPHFSIVSSASAESTEAVTRSAEDTLAAVCAFAERLHLPIVLPARKMPVILFGRWQAYRDHVGRAGLAVSESVPSFYDERLGRCFLFDYADATPVRNKRQEIAQAKARLAQDALQENANDASARRQREARLRHIEQIEAMLAEHEQLIHRTFVRHEIAHQVLHQVGIQDRLDAHRRWLKEGLAMQFEEPRSVNRFRLADFLDVNAREDAIRVRDLIANPELIGPGAKDAQPAYATAWALVYYLTQERPLAFATYLRTRPAQHMKPQGPAEREIAAFERVFGVADEAFERQWRRTLENLAPARQNPTTSRTDRR